MEGSKEAGLTQRRIASDGATRSRLKYSGLAEGRRISRSENSTRPLRQSVVTFKMFVYTLYTMLAMGMDNSTLNSTINEPAAMKN